MRVIIIFKEKSDEYVVHSVGGTVVDSLNRISRLLVADIPDDKLSEVENYSSVEKVEKDISIQLDRQAVGDNYLFVGLNGYLEIPVTTYDTIIMDMEIQQRVGATTYYFDTRPVGTEYAYRSTSNTDGLQYCTAFIGGIQQTNNTDFIGSTRKTVEFKVTQKTGKITIFAGSNSKSYNTTGKIYSITIKNGSTTVAHYDMTTGTLVDQTGAGNDIALTADTTWYKDGEPIQTLVPFTDVGGNLDWSLTALRAKDYWDRGLTGKGIKVAVFDTSFPPHKFVKYKATKNILDGTSDTSAKDYGGLVHGLECASCIDSDMVNTATGWHGGMARNTEMYVAKIVHGGSVNTSSIVSAINWAMDNDVKIISKSFLINYSSNEYDSTLIAIDEFVNNDGVYFMSVGNYRTETSTLSVNYYSKVTLVGGIDRSFKRYDNGSTGSNYSDNLEFMTVYGTVPYKTNTKAPTISNEVSSGRGTSYACPLAVGVFLLYKEMYPTLTNHQILTKMGEGAVKLDGRTGWDKYYGHGLLQPNEDILKLPRRQVENGLRFDGIGSHIDCGTSSTLNLSNNFSLVFDLRQEYANNGYLVSRLDHTVDTKPYYGIYLGHKGKPGNNLYASYAYGSTFKEESHPMSIANMERNRLVVVYNYPNILTYLNGVLINTSTMSGSMITSTGSQRLLIGTSNIAQEGSFCGILYGAKVYNKSLSASEVLSEFQGTDQATVNLVLHYEFNGSEVSSVTDLSGKGNNGTILGAIPSVRKI